MSKSEEKEKTLTDNQDKESEVNDKDLKETPEQKLKTIEEKNTIIEAMKAKDINNIDNNKLISINSYDKLIKYRQFY